MPLPHVSVTKHNHISSTIQASLHLAVFWTGLVLCQNENKYFHTHIIHQRGTKSKQP